MKQHKGFRERKTMDSNSTQMNFPIVYAISLTLYIRKKCPFINYCPRVRACACGKKL